MHTMMLLPQHTCKSALSAALAVPSNWRRPVSTTATAAAPCHCRPERRTAPALLALPLLAASPSAQAAAEEASSSGASEAVSSAADTAYESVSQSNPDVVEVIIAGGIAVGAAVLAVLTLGVVYLSLQSWLDSTEEKKDLKKLEDMEAKEAKQRERSEKKEKKGKKRARTGRGFG